MNSAPEEFAFILQSKRSGLIAIKPIHRARINFLSDVFTGRRRRGILNSLIAVLDVIEKEASSLARISRATFPTWMFSRALRRFMSCLEL